jgi:ribonuclease T2
MVSWRRQLGAAAISLLLVASPAAAQSAACALPDRLPVPERAGPPRDEARRTIPTGGYTLALSWSPQHCARSGSVASFQCDTSRNRFGFVLHGLWPDGWGKEWPQYCRPAPILPAQLLRKNLCMTPSVDLLQHEWAKHGTCMTQSPERYFERARALYDRLHFPDMAKLSGSDRLTVASFTKALLAANERQLPNLSARAVRIRLSREGWLDEVWLCLDRQQRFATCRASQGGGAAQERRMRIQMLP